MKVPHATSWQINGVLVVLIESTADVDEVGILCLEAVVQSLEAVGVCRREPILVTNLDVGDLERLWVTVLAPKSTVCGRLVSHGVLNLIKSILKNFVHAVWWVGSSILTPHI